MSKTLMTILAGLIGGTAWADSTKPEAAPTAWSPMAMFGKKAPPPAPITVTPAEPAAPAEPIQPAATATVLPMKDGALVLFDFDKSNVAGSYNADLQMSANWINEHPQHYLVIEGHTDEVGTDAYNAGLATRRGENVRSELLALGANGERLVVGVFGEAVPASTNDADNRRVVVRGTEESLAQITARTFLDGFAVVWEYEPSAEAVATRE